MRDMNVGIIEEIDDQTLAGAAGADGPAVTAELLCGPSVVNCPIMTHLVCVTIGMPELPNCT
ncbi:hypothetical protein ACFXKD_25765 [Nocardiopsis aegyptia]|uniref:hypothetical protein n=1 Tax=Nocardiopsis aegyptia TaxID=220378 RepID=UPI00366DA9EA